MNDDENVLENIKNISEQVKDEMNKDEYDKEKIFKLMYSQMIQGLYLTEDIIGKR